MNIPPIDELSPFVVCWAEERAVSLGLNVRLGVSIASVVPDDGRLLFVYVENRQEVFELGAKWGNRAVYYKRRVWKNNRQEGIDDEIINFLLLSMCGQIDGDVPIGALAIQYGGQSR